MERVARIPLARRRRPKPPAYWAALVACVIIGFVMLVDILGFIAEPRIDGGLAIAHRSLLLTIARMCMRHVDPDDDYIANLEYVRRLFLTAVALAPVVIIVALLR